MPELPEVETIRRGLEQAIAGRIFTRVESLHPKSLQTPMKLLEDKLVRAKITSFDRFGKVLVVNLNSDYSLMMHLKMTGQVVLVQPSGERSAGGHPTRSMADKLPDSSTKLIFDLDDDSKLYFNDQRVFGWVRLVPTADVAADALIARLGPEPLTEKFELKQFAEKLARRPKAPIKAVILDQSTVAGVGNIYADESLHLAKIHPLTPAAGLTPAQVRRLYEAIKTIIALGVDHGGTSFTNYVNALGGTGDYLHHARVFRRQGGSCPVCGSEIIKTRVAGRGTHLCPTCQKAPAEKAVT